MRLLYQRKHTLCTEALSRLPKKLIEIHPSPSGLNILLTICSHLTERELIKRAFDNGIIVAGAQQFYHDKKLYKSNQPQVLLEFGGIPEGKIEMVIQKLFNAWVPDDRQERD